MMVIQQYKDKYTKDIYQIKKPSFDQIDKHCSDYLNDISLSTNILFSNENKENQLKQMYSIYDNGITVIVTINNIEECFAYINKDSPRTYNVIALHTYNSYKAKILLINYLYNLNKTLRYTPKDIWILPDTSLLNPKSLKLFRNKQNTSVKFKHPLWDKSFIKYLGLKEI